MAGIAPREASGLTQLIAELGRDLGVLLVEHDMDVVFEVSSTITVLDQGRKIAEGTPAAIRADAAVQQLYLRDDVDDRADPTDPTDAEEPTDAAR